MYITAASTISHQPTFRNKGFSAELSALNHPSGIRHPDYNEFIPMMNKRRMSDVLKMAIACSVDCLEQTGLKQPDAIIVGTSMGCSELTKNFLDKILNATSNLLSPTSFILSTHNTIAGQISLLLGNHQYNMTHTQNSLSFEHALIDATVCIKEGCSNVLVGAADEMENSLYNISARLNSSNIHSTYGASFFVLSAENTDPAGVNLVDVASFGLVDDFSSTIADFLNSNDVAANEVDLLLFSCNHQITKEKLSRTFYHCEIIDYQKISGSYFTNSSFAMHYGVDILLHTKYPNPKKRISRILICNNSIPENLGLILINISRV